MTAIEILAEIARLSALLPSSIPFIGDDGDDSGWDIDVPAALGHLYAARRDQRNALLRIEAFTARLEEPGWIAATDEISRVVSADETACWNLRKGQKAALAAQKALAAEVVVGH